MFIFHGEDCCICQNRVHEVSVHHLHFAETICEWSHLFICERVLPNFHPVVKIAAAASDFLGGEVLWGGKFEALRAEREG